MAKIVLIRHAQASFSESGSLTEGYDQLSDLGVRQAQALAETLAAVGTEFDRVLIGPAKRHHQTAEIVAAHYGGRGLSWPEPEVVDAVDEHQGAFVMTRALERASDDPELADLAARLEAGGEERLTAFFHAYRLISTRWARRELPPEVAGDESWQAFRRRVERAVQTLVEQCTDGETVGVFTSGGPVSAATGWVLGLDDLKTMELTWVMRNATMTELLFPFGRVVLGSFNMLPRFPTPEMATYL